MGTLYKTKAGIDRSRKNFFNPQILQRQNISHHIDNRINSAYFMEMYLLHRTSVDFGFRPGYGKKYLFSFGYYIRRKIRLIQNFFYIVKVPMLVVMVMLVFMSMFMAVYMFLFVMMIITVHMVMIMPMLFFYFTVTVGNAMGMHPCMVMNLFP